MDLYRGNADILGIISALRSQKMREVWKNLSDGEYDDWCDNIAAS